MAHEKRIVTCAGPQDPHAFDCIPVLPRAGNLDKLCPKCLGHGGWNSEIDLASLRAMRVLCDKCDGRGWIETGDDMVPSHDIERGPDGVPRWVTRLTPSDDRE